MRRLTLVCRQRHEGGKRRTNDVLGHPDQSCAQGARTPRKADADGQDCRYAAKRDAVQSDENGQAETLAGTDARKRTSVSRWVLRAPGGPVDLDRDALRVGPRVDQLKRDVRAGVGEQPRALAEDHGDDDELDSSTRSWSSSHRMRVPPGIGTPIRDCLGRPHQGRPMLTAPLPARTRVQRRRARVRVGDGPRHGLRGRSRARARERLAPGGHDAARQQQPLRPRPRRAPTKRSGRGCRDRASAAAARRGP